MFNKYQGKAVERLAHEVTAIDIIRSLDESTSDIEIEGEKVEFKHYEPVNVGDFIVYLTDEDIYHCSRKVFLDRNHIEGVDLDFGTAVKVMKSGGKVARKGWNGASMFAWFNVGGKKVAVDPVMEDGKFSTGGLMKMRPHFLLKTAQDDVAVWNPSTSDCLANDWFIVE